MEITANEIQNIQRMNWLRINIINVIIATYVNSSLGVNLFFGVI